MKKEEKALTDPEKRTSTANPRLYAVLYAIFSRVIRFIHRVTIEGAENEPTEGAFLVCPNHLSDFDVLIVAASLKRQVRYCAKAELFKIPVLSSLIRALGAYPIRRGEGDVGAIKKTIALLKEGEVVGLYPQGTRYAGVDPRTTKPRQGAAMVAFRTGVPVVPVCIETKDFRVVPFRKTVVRIGKPVTVEELGILAGTPEDYRRGSEAIFARITDMIEAPLPAIR